MPSPRSPRCGAPSALATLPIERDVHTLFWLPTGIFYAQGVNANVLFFDKKPASEKPWTKKLWVYDLRRNQHFTLKTNTLRRADLDDFVACYRALNRHQRKATWSEKSPDGRFRAFDYAEITARDKCSLDVFWLKDESLEATQNLPPTAGSPARSSRSCARRWSSSRVWRRTSGPGEISTLSRQDCPTCSPRTRG